MLPVTKEVFNYGMNWELVEKHEKMRPWISNIARTSTDEEAADIVSQILEYMKYHDSVSSIHKKITSFGLVSEGESERLFRNTRGKSFSLRSVSLRKACPWIQ